MYLNPRYDRCELRRPSPSDEIPLFLPMVMAICVFFTVMASAELCNDCGATLIEPDLDSFDGRVAHNDDDGDGRVDRVVVFDWDANAVTVARDTDGDGLIDWFRNVDLDTGEFEDLYDRNFDGVPDE